MFRDVETEVGIVENEGLRIDSVVTGGTPDSVMRTGQDFATLSFGQTTSESPCVRISCVS
jgi:hypothetical protein